ncbi:hypothetical protein VOLCADRAFT_120938 [Volvox carteri f. nagariensis]|uniref:Carbonic anhydrase n=1 Tax=Volvox carteri f. nagariensis TaxID=3068 RepID=D8TXI1_VOLCA|nr:uncharacterized protein VOLCADRAFT_120938 [Volvox carteri f. nagariensis]EFJ47914.1 hypothetical protein VOLCADRAFT_120938 [Volvox carteri f. nagariensis]|eukprot:XP_002951020.1 hypothetical protein VOLCADRAFT_120938 [Volvox carteri f. nagariensis]
MSPASYPACPGAMAPLLTPGIPPPNASPAAAAGTAASCPACTGTMAPLLTPGTPPPNASAAAAAGTMSPAGQRCLSQRSSICTMFSAGIEAPACSETGASPAAEPLDFGKPLSGLKGLSDPDPLDKLLKKNRAWSAARIAEDPQYFNRLCTQQAPEYLWIGCSDSRVPANAILGLEPGEVFVQRNVGNQATHTDLNCMSCLEYAVKELKVRNIILCGHYGCGAVKAALKMPSKTHNLVNCWISDIRECRNQHRAELMALPNLEAQTDRLCELNVLRQTFNVCTGPVVQSAWDKGQSLHIYGVVYSLKDGLIKKLVGPISKNGDFAHDQTTFAELGSTYVGYQDIDGGRTEAERAASPVCESYKSRMDAFNAYMNTVEVNNRIAQHVGWSDDMSAAAAKSAAAAAAAAAAATAADAGADAEAV